jgi:ribosomal protein L24
MQPLWCERCRACIGGMSRQVRKHVRPQGEQAGGVFSVESPIHVSNVALADPVSG